MTMYACHCMCMDTGPPGRLKRYSKVMTRSDGYNHLGSALKTQYALMLATLQPPQYPQQQRTIPWSPAE